MRSTSFTLYPSDAPHISKLQTHYAEALALFRENSNYETMAAAANVPIGTIKSRLHRARAAIVEMRAKAAKPAEAA